MLNKLVLIDFNQESFDKKYLDKLEKLFKSIEFIANDDPEKIQKVSQAETLLVQMSTRVEKELIDGAPQLKYIGVQATGFSAIDVKHARSKNITVCNLGGYSTEAVSEFFFAALLENVRDLERAKLQAREEDYSFQNFKGLELQGKTLGVIGAGKIGSRIAEIGIGLGMKVIYTSRNNKVDLDKKDASKVELDELLSNSDFISLNLSLNKETEGIISKENLEKLKKGCIFISLSPPPLVDQEAIMEKCNKDEMVFIFDHSDDIDPKLAKRFLDTKNCVVYPPVAFRTEEADQARWEILVENLDKFISGTPQNVVN